MQYAILIYGNESAWRDGGAEMITEFNAYTQALIAAGVMRGGHELRSVSTATSVRMRDQRVQMTDGPFAETKEQLGGLFVIDTPTLEEALEWAAKCPGAKVGTIEVRPIVQAPVASAVTA
jgi:hypothetical protein